MLDLDYEFVKTMSFFFSAVIRKDHILKLEPTNTISDT